ncbi:hypothetical protein [Microbacterium sp. zg.Y909]|uniref:hypothetical protein n=1 Tax=Microbacterium sp. zg.Y909 TaxID=2969413 RepID=UPI00214BF191|nr:hypothetical protein [Microbacterium sp. zg.Y909]MCR2825327.1 hypothetical protein [Microbacterium sp. zg.Y909]
MLLEHRGEDAGEDPFLCIGYDWQLAPEVGAENGVIAVRSGVTTDMVHVAVQ